MLDSLLTEVLVASDLADAHVGDVCVLDFSRTYVGHRMIYGLLIKKLTEGAFNVYHILTLEDSYCVFDLGELADLYVLARKVKDVNYYIVSRRED